jgi:hypothetical protein
VYPLPETPVTVKVKVPDFLVALDANVAMPSGPVVRVDVPVTRPDHRPVTRIPATTLPPVPRIVTAARADVPALETTFDISMFATYRILFGSLVAVIATDLLFVAPRSSVTVSVAVKFPAEVYVCHGFAELDVPPSPKLHEKAAIVPSGSEEPKLEKETFIGAYPLTGVAAATATGGLFGRGVTVIVTVAVELRPPLSVTISVATKVPSLS